MQSITSKCTACIPNKLNNTHTYPYTYYPSKIHPHTHRHLQSPQFLPLTRQIHRTIECVVGGVVAWSLISNHQASVQNRIGQIVVGGKQPFILLFCLRAIIGMRSQMRFVNINFGPNTDGQTRAYMRITRILV